MPPSRLLVLVALLPLACDAASASSPSPGLTPEARVRVIEAAAVPVEPVEAVHTPEAAPLPTPPPVAKRDARRASESGPTCSDRRDQLARDIQARASCETVWDCEWLRDEGLARGCGFAINASHAPWARAEAASIAASCTDNPTMVCVAAYSLDCQAQQCVLTRNPTRPRPPRPGGNP